MKLRLLGIVALVLAATPLQIGAQTSTDSTVLARAIEAVLSHRSDLQQERISLALDERRAENVTRRATLQLIARAMGNGRAVFRSEINAVRDCRTACRSPFPEPLLIVSSIGGRGSDRLVVMSLVMPDAVASGVELAVRTGGARPRSAGSLFLVTLKQGSRGWAVSEVKEGHPSRAP